MKYMKVLSIVLIAIACSCHTCCQAQNWNEWFNQEKTQHDYHLQQIAALQVYLGYVKKGYEVVRKGLTLIGDIKEGNFSLHKNYFASLEAVNPAISNSAKVACILALQQLIHKDVQQRNEECRNNEIFTDTEIGYLLNVHKHLLEECDKSMDDLTTVVTNDDLQMKDDERIARIDEILDEMENMYAFTRSFGNNTRLLALQRYQERSDITVIKKIYDVEP